MEFTLLSVLALGFILGIKHAVEPDHVIAVSTIASRSKKIWHASLAGVFWGIGHTATLFIVGITFILMKGEIPETWAMSLEFLVGIMLVYLGVTTILSLKNVHVHEHDMNMNMMDMTISINISIPISMKENMIIYMSIKKFHF